MAEVPEVTRPIDKIYIIRINHPLSLERAADCAQSCEDVGMPYEFWPGTQGIQEKDLPVQFDPPVKFHHKYNIPVMNATTSHIRLWNHIAKNKETAIILEHDAIMLHKVDIPIPDGAMVMLGYKLMNKDEYDHVSAGPPKEIGNVFRHSGAHAYAITWKTAEELMEEVYTHGVRSCIDTGWFMHNGNKAPWGKKDPPPPKQSGIPIKLMTPTPAIGWVRDEKSTVGWRSGEANFFLTSSFKQNLKKKK